jgi:hypothetical protein
MTPIFRDLPAERHGSSYYGMTLPLSPPEWAALADGKRLDSANLACW